MRIMPPADALTALDSALRIKDPQIAIASLDWPKYLGQIPEAQRSFYAELVGESAAAAALAGSIEDHRLKSERRSSGAVEEGRDAKLSRIMDAPVGGRRAAILRLLEDVVRRTLDLRSSELLDPDKLLSDLGMDSLLAIEMRNNLSAILDRRVPSTFVFDYPTLQKMVRFVDGELFPAVTFEPLDHGEQLTGEDPPSGLGAPSILDDIEQLSDEEVDSMFEKKVHQ
jgi:acyl carrier protein